MIQTLQVTKEETLVYINAQDCTIDKAYKVLGRHSASPQYFILEAPDGKRAFAHQTDPVWPVTMVRLP